MLEQDNNGHYRSGAWGTGKDYGTNKDSASMSYFADKYINNKNSSSKSSGSGCLGYLIIGVIIFIGFLLKSIWEEAPWVYAILGIFVLLLIIFSVRKSNKQNLFKKANPLIDEGRWTEAKEYIERLATKYKDKDACRVLGDMYYNGNGVEKNSETAKSWYEKACSYGDVGYSEFMQGFILSPKPENTSDESMEFIKNASRSESIDGIIECVWRYSYRNKEIDKKDYKRAFKALEKLAKKQSLPASQLILGDAYEKGVVIEKNLQSAFEYYRMAADQNYWPAMVNLERCYENGIGVSQNSDEAEKWHDLANKFAKEEGIDLFGE